MAVHNMLDNRTFVLRVEDPSMYLQRLCVLSVYDLCDPTLDGAPTVKSAKDKFGVFETSARHLQSNRRKE